MSKISITVVIVIAMVIGYFALNSDKTIPYAEDQYESQEPADSGRKMAFSDLVAQGGSYKCEVKQYISDFENEGTVYMSGNDLSGSFSTVAEGTTVESNFIMRDGYMYNWSSAAPGMGIKIKADAGGKAQSGETYTWSTEQVGEYDCEAWTPDQAMFTLPEGVTFTEVSA